MRISCADRLSAKQDANGKLRPDNPDEQHGPQRAGAARGRLNCVMTQKVHSVQIDAAGHERIDRLAKDFGFTQAGAASVIVRVAKNKRRNQTDG